MRYYHITLKANADYIEQNATVRLKDYDYSSVAALNNYIHRNRINHFSFYVYREESEVLQAIFAFNEEKMSFQYAHDYILGVLDDVFKIRQTKGEPIELTSKEYFECILEGKRRIGISYSARSTETFPDWIFQYYDCDDESIMRRTFHYEECLIPRDPMETYDIYDKSVKDEIHNIRNQEIRLDKTVNLVHYILSTKSKEATEEITKNLVQNLYDAKRVTSRRICFVREITPTIYSVNNHLEDFIENNSGGVIVIDLTEKLGHRPEDYKMTCVYLEKVFKKYRNKCLFVFTYNVDHPGFSYTLLPNLQKYMIPVTLKEGKGNRAVAEEYLKSHILETEYAKYASQAKEFLSRYPQEEFSQSEVLLAFEQFEPWCVNKNILKAYNYEPKDDFLLDRDSHESSYDKLQKMIGLSLVKKQIDDIIATAVVEKERKQRNPKQTKSNNYHMIFAGNPGTAKTTVAELFAQIAKEKNILKSGIIVKTGGNILNGHSEYVQDLFDRARGGVLFIDEAYDITYPSTITTLLQEMENRHEEVIVVLAGYNESMRAFLDRNEGLTSRIPYWIDFPDYTTDELMKIFQLMLDERGLTATEDARNEARDIFDKARYIEDFGNGRYVRNVIENAMQNQSVRLLKSNKDLKKRKNEEIFELMKEDITMVGDDLSEHREPGEAQKELDEMIGLSSVKELIHKIIAHYKLTKRYLEEGISRKIPSRHLVFMGNPGTAKTTVARLLAQILKDEKVLPTGKFVELGRADLVSPFVGGTAQQVKQAFRKARGGVLFIDEAYSLCDDHKGVGGDEAINTIVQEMENHHEDTIVIFAGYTNEMIEFINHNSGMPSRIAFTVNFDDYNVDELCAITKLMAKKRGMKITKQAFDKIRNNYTLTYKEKNFGNGRYVRQLLEEAQMNLAMRLQNKNETKKRITTIEACDIPEIKPKKKSTRHVIGFLKDNDNTKRLRS